MNSDEIQNMPAGRKMDEIIAKTAMGWTSTVYFEQEDTGPKSDCANGFDNSKGYYTAIPFYSTDMTAAWQGVEKMRENPQILDFDLRWENDHYLCCFQVDTGYDVCNFFSSGDTAPLAIWRAILLAVAKQAP